MPANASDQTRAIERLALACRSIWTLAPVTELLPETAYFSGSLLHGRKTLSVLFSDSKGGVDKMFCPRTAKSSVTLVEFLRTIGSIQACRI